LWLWPQQDARAEGWQPRLRALLGALTLGPAICLGTAALSLLVEGFCHIVEGGTAQPLKPRPILPLSVAPAPAEQRARLFPEHVAA
jgi:hypothetical protein